MPERITYGGLDDVSAVLEVAGTRDAAVDAMDQLVIGVHSGAGLLVRPGDTLVRDADGALTVESAL